ncbi:uncharacterized protein MYCFIDRAFT_79591, partial [Pseudocercospora fijiensis CIRAD86]
PRHHIFINDTATSYVVAVARVICGEAVQPLWQLVFRIPRGIQMQKAPSAAANLSSGNHGWLARYSTSSAVTLKPSECQHALELLEEVGRSQAWVPCTCVQPPTRSQKSIKMNVNVRTLLSAAFFKFIKALEYETANPDQDGPSEHPTAGNRRPTSSRHSYDDFADSGVVPLPPPPQAPANTASRASAFSDEKTHQSPQDLSLDRTASNGISTGTAHQRSPVGRGGSYMA